MADGNKFFECVANSKQRVNNQFKQLEEDDLFIIMSKGSSLTVSAVGRVAGHGCVGETDRSILYSLLLPERQTALDAYLSTAPSFNYILFKEVYDLRTLALRLPELMGIVGFLGALPTMWACPHVLSQNPEVHGALCMYIQQNARCHRSHSAGGPVLQGALSASSSSAAAGRQKRPVDTDSVAEVCRKRVRGKQTEVLPLERVLETESSLSSN